MSNERPTYEELEQQLTEAQQVIAALRGGEVDAVISERDVALLRLKDVENGLRRSEENYRNSIEKSPLGIRIATAKGELLHANQATLDIYGYNSLEELRAMPAKQRYTPESYVEHEKRKEKRKRGEYVPSNYEISVVRKDGEFRHLEVFRKEVLWNGKTQFQTLYQDITERKRAEEALKAERQRLYDVLEAMPVMVCLLTPDYHVAFGNRAFREKFGESHGRRCYDYCFGKKEPCDFCEAYRVLKTAKPHHWQVTTLAGASVIDVYDLPFTDADGSPMILEVDIDITEREQAEKALKISENRYRDLVDNALIGVYQSSLDGTILFANDSLMWMLEYSSLEDLASGKVSRFYRDAHDRALFINLLKADGKVPAFEAEMVTKTGAVKTVLLSASLDGELLSGMVLDITERKKAEAAIMSAKYRLEQLSRRLLEVQENDRRMLARELHDEIGQMLTAAKIDLQVIRRSPLHENLAARLDNSVATLDQCLRQVRNLSLSLRPSMLDDLGLVAALRWQLDHLSQRVGFHAQLIADEIPGRFHPDIDTACFRIVQEALTNVARHAEANNVEVELRVRGREILLSIRDDGGGFDVERAMAGASHGTTLGILGMQERATLLDGKLEIASAGKLGTTVTARLPLRSAESQE